MENSRRDFIKKIGLTGLAAMSLPEIISANKSFEFSKYKKKNKG